MRSHIKYTILILQPSPINSHQSITFVATSQRKIHQLMDTLLLQATSTEPNLLLEAVKVLASPAATVVVAVLTYSFAVKKLRYESQEQVEKDKYNRYLEASRQTWMLMAYMTDKENEKTIFTYIRDRKTKEDTHYFTVANGKQYLKEYANLVHNNGHGLFLTQQTFALLAEYRHFVFGILLSEKENSPEKIVVNNLEGIKRMRQINEELSAELRNNLNLRKPENILGFNK